jgi:hypothetical protein
MHRYDRNSTYGDSVMAELARVVPVVIAVAICVAGMFLVSRQLSIKHPPESAEATLVRTETTQGSTSRRKSNHVPQPIWSFTASDGVEYEVTGESVAHWNMPGPSVGDKSIIFYHPDHPASGYVIEADQKVAVFWGLYFAVFPALFIVVLFAIRLKEAQQGRGGDAFVSDSIGENRLDFGSNTREN